MSGVEFQIGQNNRYEFHIISKHINIKINLTRRRYDFLQFHIGQFSYRASCKGRLSKAAISNH